MRLHAQAHRIFNRSEPNQFAEYVTNSSLPILNGVIGALWRSGSC